MLTTKTDGNTPGTASDDTGSFFKHGFEWHDGGALADLIGLIGRQAGKIEQLEKKLQRQQAEAASTQGAAVASKELS